VVELQNLQLCGPTVQFYNFCAMYVSLQFSPVLMHFGMLKQVKPHFVNRNLASCLTLIGT